MHPTGDIGHSVELPTLGVHRSFARIEGLNAQTMKRIQKIAPMAAPMNEPVGPSGTFVLAAKSKVMAEKWIDVMNLAGLALS